MKVYSIIQKDNVNTLKEEFLNNSNKDFKKMYVFLGTLKETGFDVLEECLIDNKARKIIAFAYDKKNTTKKMLDIILKYTKNVWIYNNNRQDELNSNIWIFENNKTAYVYFLSGSLSSPNLSTDMHIYTKLEFDIQDTKEKKEYDSFVNNLTELLKSDNFVKLNKEYIEELSNSKEIFSTRQYVYNVPNLSDLINNGTIKKSGINKDIETNLNFSKNKNHEGADGLEHINVKSMEEISFDIDISEAQKLEKTNNKVSETKETINYNQNDKENIDIEAGQDKEYIIPLEDSDKEYKEIEKFEEVEAVIDMEKEIFSSSIVKLDKRKVESNLEKMQMEENITKKIDLMKVSNLIMELPKKPTKGKEVNVIKIPNYIKEAIPNFFEAIAKAKTVTKIDGIKYKQSTINIELVDVNENKKYLDKNAKLSIKTGQTYISFISDILNDIGYDENDIVRIIKLAKDSYHIEIIPKEIDEYAFWKKLCTQNFKSSVRCYGMM